MRRLSRARVTDRARFGGGARLACSRLEQAVYIGNTRIPSKPGRQRRPLLICRVKIAGVRSVRDGLALRGTADKAFTLYPCRGACSACHGRQRIAASSMRCGARPPVRPTLAVAVRWRRRKLQHPRSLSVLRTNALLRLCRYFAPSLMSVNCRNHAAAGCPGSHDARHARFGSHV